MQFLLLEIISLLGGACSQIPEEKKKLPLARNTGAHARQRSPCHKVSTSQILKQEKIHTLNSRRRKPTFRLPGFPPANYSPPIPSPALLCCDSQANPSLLGFLSCDSTPLSRLQTRVGETPANNCRSALHTLQQKASLAACPALQ